MLRFFDVADLSQIANCPKHRFHLSWSIYDAACHARIRNSIRSRRSDNLLTEKALYDFLRFHSFYIKANDAGRKILISRRVELNVWHPCKSFFHLTIQLVCACGDSPWSYALMKADRFRQCPILLERLKTSGSQSSH